MCKNRFYLVLARRTEEKKEEDKNALKNKNTKSFLRVDGTVPMNSEEGTRRKNGVTKIKCNATVF